MKKNKYNSVHIRIDPKLKSIIDKKTPHIKGWNNKIKFVYDTSFVKYQEAIDGLSTIMWGKSINKKVFKNVKVKTK